LRENKDVLRELYTDVKQIEWKGTDKGCTKTYIQAALTVPY
jgi:hypothetical protein